MFRTGVNHVVQSHAAMSQRETLGRLDDDAEAH
jgi:hypothetical protein